MRIPLPLVLLPFLALSAAGAIHAQITNPIPAPIVKRGLSVEIVDVARLPDTRGLRPADQDVVPAGWARNRYWKVWPKPTGYWVPSGTPSISFGTIMPCQWMVLA